MDERVTYVELKSQLLENYWDSCRDRGPLRKEQGAAWTHEQIVSDVYDGYAGAGSFESPLEYLMLEVVAIVLSCWYPDQVAHHRMQIKRMLTENDLDEMLSCVPDDEAESLRHDLAVLRLI